MCVVSRVCARGPPPPPAAAAPASFDTPTLEFYRSGLAPRVPHAPRAGPPAARIAAAPARRRARRRGRARRAPPSLAATRQRPLRSAWVGSGLALCSGYRLGAHLGRGRGAAPRAHRRAGAARAERGTHCRPPRGRPLPQPPRAARPAAPPRPPAQCVRRRGRHRPHLDAARRAATRTAPWRARARAALRGPAAPRAAPPLRAPRAPLPVETTAFGRPPRLLAGSDSDRRACACLCSARGSGRRRPGSLAAAAAPRAARISRPPDAKKRRAPPLAPARAGLRRGPGLRIGATL